MGALPPKKMGSAVSSHRIPLDVFSGPLPLFFQGIFFVFRKSFSSAISEFLSLLTTAFIAFDELFLPFPSPFDLFGSSLCLDA